MADIDFNFAVKDLPLVLHPRPVIINKNPFFVGLGISGPSKKKIILSGALRYVVRRIDYLDNHLIAGGFFYNTVELSGEFQRVLLKSLNKSMLVTLGGGVNKSVTSSSKTAWREHFMTSGYTFEFRLDSEPKPSYFFRIACDFLYEFSPRHALKIGLGFQYQHSPLFFVEEEIIGLQRTARSGGIRPHYFWMKIDYVFQLNFRKQQ